MASYNSAVASIVPNLLLIVLSRYSRTNREENYVDTQTLINTFLGLIAFLGGWIMHSFKSQLNDNRQDIKGVNDRVHAVEVLVAGKYMTREESKEQTDMILNKLDTIRTDIRSCMLHNLRKDDACEP